MRPKRRSALAYMILPNVRGAKLHRTNPIERLNDEIKRRKELDGIFPNDDAIIRHLGAILLKVGHSAGALHDAGNNQPDKR